MLYIANWSIVLLLFALWSLAAWAFHGLVVWAVTVAPTLTGPAADLSSVPFEPTTNGARDQEYRCTTPMCGESGVCAACRKRGMR